MDRLGWSANKVKAVLIADGKEQGSEEELRVVLEIVKNSCIEIDSVAIVPSDSNPGGSIGKEELIQYLQTIDTEQSAKCPVSFTTSDGKTLTFDEPMVTGKTYVADGFKGVRPAVEKALLLEGF